VSELPSIESRLLHVLAGIAVVAILGVLAILPYRLYSRDIRNAEVHAHRISSVAQTALVETLREGRDATDLVNRLQSIADFDIQLVRVEAGEGGEGLPASSDLDGTRLVYSSASIADRQGRRWQVQTTFDLSPLKRESVRLIIDLVVTVVLGSAVFSALVFWVVRRGILDPLRKMTEIVRQLGPGAKPLSLPEFHSREMADLAGAVERARHPDSHEIDPDQRSG
jgi:hypothetical protein